jgi:predicted nucleotidyltransferase
MAVNARTEIVTEDRLQFIASRVVAAVQPEEIILFGSQANGTARPHSDIDLLVIMPDGAHTYGGADSVYRKILDSLRDDYYPMDLLVYTRSKAEEWRGAKGHVLDDCFTAGRTLYVRP